MDQVFKCHGAVTLVPMRLVLYYINTQYWKFFFFKKWAIPGLISCLFSSFQYSCQYTNFPYKSFPMTGFEPRTSGVGSDRSINCFTFDQILQFYFFRTLAFWHRNYAFWSLQKRCCCELFDQNMKRSLFDRYAIDWTVR